MCSSAAARSSPHEPAASLEAHAVTRTATRCHCARPRRLKKPHRFVEQDRLPPSNVVDHNSMPSSRAGFGHRRASGRWPTDRILIAGMFAGVTGVASPVTRPRLRYRTARTRAVLFRSCDECDLVTGRRHRHLLVRSDASRQPHWPRDPAQRRGIDVNAPQILHAVRDPFDIERVARMAPSRVQESESLRPHLGPHVVRHLRTHGRAPSTLASRTRTPRRWRRRK